MSDVDPHLPDSVDRQMRELERRIRTLEASNRLTSASIHEGSLEVFDEDRNSRLVIGQLVEDEDHYGIQALDANGNVRVHADERGLLAPSIPATVVGVSAAAESTTSGVHTPLYFLSLPEVAHEGLEVRVDWRIVDGSTGRIRIGASAPLTGTTNEAIIAGPGSGSLVFRWLHGQTLGVSPFGFAITARRNSGAGAIDVYPPTAFGRSPDGCTAGGI